MKIAFEDNFEDVLTKAAVGQRLGHGALAEAAGLNVREVRALFAGEFDARAARLLCGVLQLDADKLVAMVEGKWHPQPVELTGLTCFNMPFPQSGYAYATVNNFLVFNAETKEALIFDAGVDAAPVLDLVAAHQLRVKALLLTHTHRDHVAGYAHILKATGCELSYAPELEPFADARTVSHRDRLELAGFKIEVRLTNGHSPGGVTYVIEGLGQSVAIVGDSIFSCSQGGAKQAYELALKNNREQILSLPNDTILCPGHGPMTTVGEELAHNPFF